MAPKKPYAKSKSSKDILSSLSLTPIKTIVRHKPKTLTPTKKLKSPFSADENLKILKILKWDNNETKRVSNALTSTKSGLTLAITLWWNTSKKIITFAHQLHLIGKIIQVHIKKFVPSTKYDPCDIGETAIIDDVIESQNTNIDDFENVRIMNEEYDKCFTFLELEEDEIKFNTDNKVSSGLFKDNDNNLYSLSCYDKDTVILGTMKPYEQYVFKHLQTQEEDKFSFRFGKTSFSSFLTKVQHDDEEDVYDIKKLNIDMLPVDSDSGFFHLKDINLSFDVDDISSHTKFVLKDDFYIRFRQSVLNKLLKMNPEEFAVCKEKEKAKLAKEISGYFDLRLKMFKGECFICNCRQVNYLF